MYTRGTLVCTKRCTNRNITNITDITHIIDTMHVADEYVTDISSNVYHVLAMRPFFGLHLTVILELMVVTFEHCASNGSSFT